MCIYIYTYTHTTYTSYMYMCICVYMYIHICIYIYIYTHKQRMNKLKHNNNANSHVLSHPWPGRQPHEAPRRTAARPVSEISSCFLGRDPGTLKSAIVSKKHIHNKFARI